MPTVGVLIRADIVVAASPKGGTQTRPELGGQLRVSVVLMQDHGLAPVVVRRLTGRRSLEVGIPMAKTRPCPLGPITAAPNLPLRRDGYQRLGRDCQAAVGAR